MRKMYNALITEGKYFYDTKDFETSLGHSA